MKTIKFHFGASQLNTLTLNRNAIQSESQVKQILNILMCPARVWEAIVSNDNVKQVTLFNSASEMAPYVSPHKSIHHLDRNSDTFIEDFRALLSSHNGVYLNGTDIQVLALGEDEIE
ncbi:hypothetical protein JA33_299 [Dickeya phage vB_DsoM_JA33]|uniref:Uncharacterized protein n=3 Tax=Salmondvirus JA11 TaxID=2734141 RepID=A0A384ZWU9_9CAUD|nr:hypothetical protein HOU32_gp298 [Dickeya phage vB_DsoM_JA11]AXG66704.1 hypothetical protein JA13_301 [Dickeya phage vB_DsoM_JA13]AXG67673.1 hypothetical protein JA33_299 [Dickeya phage vB_DsoM_JA33]AYD80103.1 hypothetical protein JA11_298 [Dickeya phage vB_DsoM_JA11]